MPEEVWPRLSHEERSERRWTAFLGPGFGFASPRAEAEYRARAVCLKTAIPGRTYDILDPSRAVGGCPVTVGPYRRVTT